jgi:hypothetical protein
VGNECARLTNLERTNQTTPMTTPVNRSDINKVAINVIFTILYSVDSYYTRCIGLVDKFSLVSWSTSDLCEAIQRSQ